MQPGGLGVVGNRNLHAGGHQLVHGLGFGRAGEGGGQQPDGYTPIGNDPLQLGHDQPYAGPPDERHDQVDPVSGGDLLLQLRRQMRLTMGVDQQIVQTQRDVRAGRGPWRADGGGRVDGAQDRWRPLRGVAGLVECG